LTPRLPTTPGTTRPAIHGSKENPATVDAAEHDPRDAPIALLLQVTQHAESLAALDEREAAHYQEIAARLTDLAQHLSDTTDAVVGIQTAVGRQAALLGSLDGLDQQVAAFTAKLSDLVQAHAHEDADDDDSYQPAPTARWWKLTRRRTRPGPRPAASQGRADLPSRLRPLAAALGPCWDQHPLCLYGLDWLMELWSILYLAPDRTAGTIASQAEWHTRLLPALAEQLYLETTRCQHARQPGAQQPPSTRPSGRPGRRTMNADADRRDHFHG
jgi:hypothetical protein